MSSANERKTTSIVFDDTISSWKTMSLSDFLIHNTPANWTDFFSKQKVRDEIVIISRVLEMEPREIYPDIVNVFRAMYLTHPEHLKAVILGQDPYYNGSAVGLAFSVKTNSAQESKRILNPSILNIYKELRLEGIEPLRTDGDLNHWATQQILLINSALTVVKDTPGIHIDLWSRFTRYLIKYINRKNLASKQCSQLVWLLFGVNAYKCIEKINMSGRIIRTSHPSPFSATVSSKNVPAFIGSGVFKSVQDVIW